MGAWSGFSLPTPCPLVQAPVNEDLQAVKNFASKPWNVRVSGVSPVPAQSSGAGIRDGHWTEPGSSGKRLVSITKGRAHLCLDVPVRSQQIFCRNFTAESGAVIRVKTSQVFNTDPFTCVNKQRVRAGFECHNSFFSPPHSYICLWKETLPNSLHHWALPPPCEQIKTKGVEFLRIYLSSPSLHWWELSCCSINQGFPKNQKLFSIKKWHELWSSIHWVTTEHPAPNWAGLVYKQTFLSQLKMAKSWLGYPWPSCFLGFLQNLDISLAVLHSSFPEINNLVAKLQNHSCWILESFPFPLFSLCD